jgi:putative alpha-1,2-mannosidase
VIKANPAADGTPRYVQSARFNGKAQTAVWLDVDALQHGGTLEFALAAESDPQGWGTHPGDAPAAACPAMP